MHHLHFITMLTHYGYAGMFLLLFLGIVGLPFPIEMILLGAGYIVTKGHMQFAALIGIAWLGASAGMMFNYMLGRKIGIRRISRITKWIGLTERKLEGWAARFTKHGSFILLIGFYITGFRHAAPFIAGATRMRPIKFMTISTIGALSWILILVFLGQKLGIVWDLLAHHLDHPRMVVATAAGVLLSLAVVKLLVRQRRLFA
ncbi:DedA family protein [Paenibacillus whitsoniae]|uniref:DedA family protein n=1 Tax=Paenibacillus whitsoniae TaxID=2496558 RepID=A0A430JDZ5_9BACL|nr:DedA family protein [Paenibacillus whitsoniae]RTE09225.1 DedA family protein [Paenibacillus whitsoniae]